MYEFYALIALLFGSSESSVVIDRESQDALHISDYCPESPHCVEGSHVMCMYYNPDKTFGPLCYDPQNVTIDATLATKLMKLLNAVRAKLALGKETGMKGELLPRAYGMMKLGWDNELATFAQVLANQCDLQVDLCRATSKFQSPGQIIGSYRFKYPDWEPMYKPKGNVTFHSSYLTYDKLLHAMTGVVQSWYWTKQLVTPTTVLQFPDFSKTSAQPKHYLDMIYGPSTHVGCGVSASTIYSFKQNAEVILNRVIVICNFSSKPSRDKPVYTTEPPTKVGYTVKCGCPPGYDEDERCLCSEMALTDKCFMKKCQTNVILLPIVTVEDAPPHKLVPPYQTDTESGELFLSMGNSSYFNHLNQYRKNTEQRQRLTNRKINEQQRIGYRRTTVRPIVNLRYRFFDKKTNVPRLSYQPPRNSRYNQAKKTSIFTKVPVFDLSKKGDQGSSYIHNVQPRKDFSSAKNFVEDYMNMRSIRIGTVNQINYVPKTRNNQPKMKTETYLTSAEEKALNYNYHQQDKIITNISEPRLLSDDFTVSELLHERSDDNLMQLLNKLEQEVLKHTEIDGVEREIFDAKIRKIYGAITGNPVDLYSIRHPDGDTDTDFLTNGATVYKFTKHNKYINPENFNRNPRKLYHKPALLYLKEMNFNNNHYDRNVDFHRVLNSKYDPEYNYELAQRIDNSKDIFRKYEEINPRNGFADKDGKLRDIYAEMDGIPIGNSRNALIHEESDKEYVRNLRSKYDPELNYELSPRTGYSNDNFRKNEEINPRNGFADKNGKLRDIYAEMDGQERHNNIIENRPLEYNNPIDSERRKYYKTKLENLERKLRKSKTHRKGNKDRPSLPVHLKTRVETPLRAVKAQLDPFYIADRARFLHGF